MSFHQKLLSLLSGIDDPTVRIEVFRTVQFLFEVYATGQADEEEIRRDLVDVITNVLAAKHPELSLEEARKMAEELAEKIMMDFRLESITRRTLRMRRIRRAVGQQAPELPF